MRGLMQDWPLTVDRVLDHARDWHGARDRHPLAGEPIVRQT